MSWQNPLLLIITVPLITGIFCCLLPDRLRLLSRLVAFGVTLGALAGSVFVFINKPLYWYNGPIRTFVADNLSSFIAIAIALFAFLVTIYSLGFITKSFGRYFGLVLITLGSAFAVAFASDFVTLAIGWGAIAVTLFLLVTLNGTDEAARAGKKALIIIGATDALMLFGIMLIWAITRSFSVESVRIETKGLLPVAAYLSLMIAALAKAGAIPLHSWLPDVAEDGPAPVTAYLPASLDKLLGIYLLAKLSLKIFVLSSAINTILLVIGSVTIVLAVVLALVQHDLKRLLGYHAVSQVGYMVLGIGTANPIGIAGGLFHMLNHAIYKSCLFLSAGSVEKRTGTTDLEKLGGLSRFMPLTFAAFLIASLSISGIPPFNGFFSKWMIYQGIIELAASKDHLWVIWLVCAMFGSALTIASFMKLLHAVFLGRPSAYKEEISEAPVSMLFSPLALAGLCVIFGIFAFQLPLPLFIVPSLGAQMSYLGTWHPIVATSLIMTGLVLGLGLYLLLRKTEFRTAETFVGGEEVGRLDRVSGTEFYDTVRGMRFVGAFYAKEESGELDIYYLARKAVYFFTEIFQKLHNGVLPTYIVWCLLGMAAIFLAVFLR